jgi:hypothetical protein
LLLSEQLFTFVSIINFFCFAGINGSIGGSDSHTESNHINSSSNGSSNGVSSRAPFLNGIASSTSTGGVTAGGGEEETEEELAQFRNKRAGELCVGFICLLQFISFFHLVRSLQ